MSGSALGLLDRAARGAASRARNLYFRALGARIEGYVWMRAIDFPRNWRDVTLEADVALDTGVVLLCSGAVTGDKLVVRAGTYVNRYTVLTAHRRVEIGRDCMIGPHCYVTDANHGTRAGEPVKAQPMDVAPVAIEDEVWLGAGVTVLPGVRIGRGAIVGAGSVVTRDIPASAIASGVPARVSRMRE